MERQPEIRMGHTLWQQSSWENYLLEGAGPGKGGDAGWCLSRVSLWAAFKMAQRKEKGTAANLTTKFRADKCNQRIYFSSIATKFLLQTRGTQVLFSRYWGKKGKGNHWVRKSNVPVGGITSWTFVISVTEEMTKSVLIYPPRWAVSWRSGWGQKVHPYVLIWFTVTRKMLRELEDVLAWWGTHFSP